ncbi:hypothetical protein M408DRAFT_328370 [Serendipita vermifera MAFF 305830]|uniref:Uncharacterized protein n=1 Tax=Serendipita vermifera MAFF 305830 TaxID=933852 RepID=A0A0C2XLL0_SERVB|nr:hypothetical protein M408DRAFT_328370 [Serendipita vermifera MAFF 305830]
MTTSSDGSSASTGKRRLPFNFKESLPPNKRLKTANTKESSAGKHISCTHHEDTNRKRVVEQLASIGKTICRAVYFTCNLYDFVDCLIAELGETPVFDIDSDLLEAVKQISTFHPLVRDVIRQGRRECKMSIRNIGDALRKGHESAQSNDIKTIKENLPYIFSGIKFEPPIEPVHSVGKARMGFHHPQCAELLRPLNANWDDPKVRALSLTTVHAPTVQDFPHFIMANARDLNMGPEGQASILDRLFISPYLIRAARVILFGPSAVNETPIPPTSRCNASKNNIRGASPELIAYITIMLRFCLSDEESYSNDCYSYIKLYDVIRKQFQDVNFKTVKKYIIDTWNSELFPRTATTGMGSSKNVISGPETRQGHLGHITAEKSAVLQIAKAQSQLSAQYDTTLTDAERDVATALLIV